MKRRSVKLMWWKKQGSIREGNDRGREKVKEEKRRRKKTLEGRSEEVKRPRIRFWRGKKMGKRVKEN